MPQTPSIPIPSLVKPKALQPGDTIAILSPAAPTVDPKDAFEQGQALLEAAGFQVKIMPHARGQYHYLAGDDAQRVQDLHDAFADPEIQGILCARGGYGCMRLLNRIDFDLIRNNPKVFIGFSDITALHLAFYQKTGLVGLYGPMMTSNLIHNEPFSKEELLKLITGQVSAPYLVPNLDEYHSLSAGEATGRLIGGNLSLLRSMLGTPYQPNTDGAILFIEDWRERYYALDRQLFHLKLAGMLDNIAGLLFCDFSELTPDTSENTQELLARLSLNLFDGKPTPPIGYGFSVGHGSQTGTLPIGIQAHFDSQAGHLTLLEQSTI
jgi:muramoyltetrapeptide carboxypeptidase